MSFREIVIGLRLFSLLVYEAQGQEYIVVPSDKLRYDLQLSAIRSAKVRYRSDWEYILHEGVVTTEKIKLILHRYDERGRIDETINLEPDGSEKSIVLWKYREDDLPLQLLEYSPQGEILLRSDYHYNESRGLVGITEYTGQGYVIQKISFDSDESAKTVIQRTWYAPDSIGSKRVLIYTDLRQGILEVIEDYTGEETLEIKRIIKRSDNGKIDREEIRNPQGELLYYLSFIYSPSGMLLKRERVYPAGNRIRQDEYNYTSSGLLAGEIEFNEKGEIVRYFKYTYD